MRRGLVGLVAAFLMGVLLALGVEVANPTECLPVVGEAASVTLLVEKMNAGWVPDRPIAGPGFYCGKRPLVRWPF